MATHTTVREVYHPSTGVLVEVEVIRDDDTMVKYSPRRNVLTHLYFQEWSVDDDGVRTGIWLIDLRDDE